MANISSLDKQVFPVGVGILAYGRPEYLRAALRALCAQSGAQPFPLVIMDNGSSVPLKSAVEDELRNFAGPVSILREESNALSPLRFVRLIQEVDAEFVLLPGDDDIPEPAYLRTAQELVQDDSKLTIFSSGMSQIDSRGRPLATRNPAPQFADQQTALGTLMTRASYCMPVTGFKKSVIDFTSIPRTRTAFDWWLWIQAWLHGTGKVSKATTLKYRQHSGQEQRFYGAQAFRNDASRMLLSVIQSAAFGKCIESWSESDLERFSQVMLLSDGPNSGDSRWGPMVQMALVDRMIGSLSGESSLKLFAQASGHAGTPASIGALKAVEPGTQISNLPVETWSRVPGNFRWFGTCALIESWREFLNAKDENENPQFTIAITCSCQAKPTSAHELRFDGKRLWDGEAFIFTTGSPPTEIEVVHLLDDVGRLTGRLHGFEIHVDSDARILSMYRRLRLARIGVVLEKAYRRWTRIRNSQDPKCHHE